jgi:hypothetical protein
MIISNFKFQTKIIILFEEFKNQMYLNLQTLIFNFNKIKIHLPAISSIKGSLHVIRSAAAATKHRSMHFE